MAFPLWLVEALSSEQMRMGAFSKYGNDLDEKKEAEKLRDKITIK